MLYLFEDIRTMYTQKSLSFSEVEATVFFIVFSLIRLCQGDMHLQRLKSVLKK
uniref:Bacteriocin immunity protein n=1 Tax=Brugia timori TaxID=42155 RepID=A0A0R3Q4T4_9BILA